ncbi:MAG: hypothetical protein R2710_29620 [Acidimicrobiales bacterium]
MPALGPLEYDLVEGEGRLGWRGTVGPFEADLEQHPMLGRETAGQPLIEHRLEFVQSTSAR